MEQQGICGGCRYRLSSASYTQGEPELQFARPDPNHGRRQQRYDEPDARTCD